VKLNFVAGVLNRFFTTYLIQNSMGGKPKKFGVTNSKTIKPKSSEAAGVESVDKSSIIAAINRARPPEGQKR
jgi:hypothetical protein